MATRITNPAGSEASSTDEKLEASADSTTVEDPKSAGDYPHSDDVAPQEDRPPMKDIIGVQYTGPYDVKIFTIKDLQKLGIENPQTDLRWSRENDFVVPKTDLSAATVDRLIGLPNFRTV
jgi:hypothetical protein